MHDVAIWHDRLGIASDEIVSHYPSITLAECGVPHWGISAIDSQKSYGRSPSPITRTAITTNLLAAIAKVILRLEHPTS